MKKFVSFLLLLAMSTVLMIGCAANDAPTSNDGNNADNTENTDNNTDDSVDFPVEMTDANDNDVTIEEEPERIVTLIPSVTETAFALDLADKIVGVSDNDDYPEEVEDIDTVGGMELNVEKIISLDPDLVLAHASALGSQEEALNQLRDSDINVVVVTDAQSIEQTYTAIEEIGDVTGTASKADDMIATMEDDFSDLEDQMDEVAEEDEKTVFMETSPEPEIFTAGQNTFWHDLLDIVNAKNAAGDEDGWVQLDPEAIVELNPDVILTTYGETMDDAKEQVLKRDGFDEVTAVEEGQIFDIDQNTVSRPGPRLVEGAENIAEAVYPEIYEE